MGAPRTNFIHEDRSAWDQAKALNTAQAYANYIALWPEGTFSEEARRRARQIREENLWTWASRQNKIVAFEQYLSQYPEGYYSREAYEQIATLEEQQAWDKASQVNAIAAYLEFRREYPDSSFSDMAAQRIVNLVKERNRQPQEQAPSDHQGHEDRALERATMQDSVMAYNQFLREFPDSAYQDEVHNRIQQLQQRLNSEFQILENEVESWDKAARLHTRYAYQEYLKQFPNGKFANVAKNRLKALDQQWRWKHRTLVEEQARGNMSAPASAPHEVKIEEARQMAALTLGWIWLGALAVLGMLCMWLAAYLLPMVVVVGLAMGAHLVMNRGKRLTRNESIPYLIGGALAIGALVQGLIFQITGQWRLSILGGSLFALIAGLGLIRLFQGQIEQDQQHG